VSGCVQGVFYRASAQRQASSLGLRGWVRNLDDNRVELLACGEQPVLEKLEKWLEIGPEHAKVTNIEIITEKSVAEKIIDFPEGFEIRPTVSPGASLSE
jgi:acylphosphatase